MARKKLNVQRYTFKAYPYGLGRTVYRVFEINGTEYLDVLAFEILECFDFSHEHMYEFSMDGDLYSPYNIICYSEEGQQTTDRVRIDQLGLSKGSKFWFHYDFGDDWVFVVSVQKIVEIENPEEPKLLRGKGAVEQYPDWDEDEDWDEEDDQDGE